MRMRRRIIIGLPRFRLRAELYLKINKLPVLISSIIIFIFFGCSSQRLYQFE